MKVQVAFDVEKTKKISFQSDFPAVTECCHCKRGKARLAFVASEPGNRSQKHVCDLYETTGKKGGLWLHDLCAVAVYFCPDCLEPTALYNQG